MASRRLATRIAQGVLLLFLPPTVVAGGVLVLLYSLGVHHRPGPLVAALVVGAAAMIAYLGFVVHGMGDSLGITLREMRLGVELMRTVHPGHRLRVETGDELEALANEINRLADDLAATRAGRPAGPAGGTRRSGRGNGDPALAEIACAAIDLETTGLDRQLRDRIVALAGVRIRASTVDGRETFEAVVNPGCPIPAASSALHGLTDRTAAGLPPIDHVLPAFVRFLSGDALVGYRLWFDLRFLRREAACLGLSAPQLDLPALDIAPLAAVVDPGLDHLNLDGLAARLGVSLETRHAARADALATAQVFVRLIPLLAARGVCTVADAMRAQGQARHAA